MVVEFDSILFKRSLIEHPEKGFEAFMSAGVTFEDENDFRKAYDDALKEIFNKHQTKRLKRICKDTVSVTSWLVVVP